MLCVGIVSRLVAETFLVKTVQMQREEVDAGAIFAAFKASMKLRRGIPSGSG